MTLINGEISCLKRCVDETQIQFHLLFSLMSILVNNSDASAASTVLLFLHRVHFYDYEKPRRHQTTCIIDNGADDITS